jgi:hypothetical protein
MGTAGFCPVTGQHVEIMVNVPNRVSRRMPGV